MHIRIMDLVDLEMVLGWATDEGWNPGIGDAPAFLQADPNGFFLGLVGDEPAAAISVVNHDDTFASLGLYLCRPKFRGQGHGHALWRHALVHAGDRAVGLDGDPTEQETYRKSGFVTTGRTYRYQGDLPARQAPRVRPVKTGDIQSLLRLDRRFQGYERRAFLRAWYGAETGTETGTETGRETGRETLVHQAPDGSVDGVVTLRHCRHGAKIGPLQATDPQIAAALLETAATRTEARPLIIDLPDNQVALTEYCQGHGMVAQFNTARMIRGTPPVPQAGLQSVATLELG